MASKRLSLCAPVAAALLLAASCVRSQTAAPPQCASVVGAWRSNALFYSYDSANPTQRYRKPDETWGRIEQTCDLAFVSANGCNIVGEITPGKMPYGAIVGAAEASGCQDDRLNRRYLLSIRRSRSGITLSVTTGVARRGHVEEHGLSGEFVRY